MHAQVWEPFSDIAHLMFLKKVDVGKVKAQCCGCIEI